MGAKPLGDADLPAYAKSLIRFKAKQLSRKPGFSRSDQEDLEQELTLHLLRHAVDFDPERGSLNTFVSRVIDSAVAMILRDRNRLKRAAGHRVRSLDIPRIVADSVTTLGAGLTPDDAHRRLGTVPDADVKERLVTLAAARASLPAGLQRVCDLLASGSEAAAARELNVSRRKIRNAKEQIKRHFDSAGLETSEKSGHVPRHRHK